MQAAVHTRYGSPEVVRIVEVGKPTIGATDVLVEVHATTPANSFPNTVARGLMSPVNNLMKKGFAAPARAVRPIHRRGMNLDEHLPVPDRRFLHFNDPNHVRRAVSGLDRSLHTGTVRPLVSCAGVSFSMW